MAHRFSVSPFAVLLVFSTTLLAQVPEVPSPEKRLSIPVVSLSTAVDTDMWRRWEMARSDKTPPESLEILSKDAVPEIRRSVVHNRNTGIMVVYSLEDDTAPTPAFSRFMTIGAEARFVCLQNSDFKYAVSYFRDPDPQIRAEVARRISKENILELLALDSSESVRAGVAGNPHASSNVLDHLGGDTSSWVRSKLPEFWQYWTKLEDRKGNILTYASRSSTSKLDANGYKTHTIWLNFAKDPKDSKQGQKQYDLECLDNRYGLSGSKKMTAAAPGSRWFKIVRAVCENYTAAKLGD